MAIDRNSTRQQVFEHLIVRAVLRKNCTYESIARAVPSLPQDDGRLLAATLSPILLEILCWCEVRGLPKLTAIVVRRYGATNAGLPGHGFWERFGFEMAKTPKNVLRSLTADWQREAFNYWQGQKNRPIPLLDSEVSMSQNTVSLQHCEIRKVPAGWVHPVDNDGQLVGLWGNYQQATAGHAEDVYQWTEMGKVKVGGQYMDIPENLRGLTALEYYGQPPQAELFMPEWDAHEATSVQLYERRTGCPVSPVMATNTDLLKWFFTQSMTPAKVDGMHDA